ncbi:UNVERIFIED_CONTAM: hypothetical protein Slati_4240200 [Sesamum latifolium]|uniref:Uncharacterized protein n=1 Tax=Sesamum latifolium TaxID=2727402 RepID=A0AAW2TBB0_9LAMI
MGSSVASSDESSVRFVIEVPRSQDPLEATFRRTDLGASVHQSGLRWSLWQAAVAARRLMDEKDVVAEGQRVSDAPEGDDGLDVCGRSRGRRILHRGGGGAESPPFSSGLGV